MLKPDKRRDSGVWKIVPNYSRTQPEQESWAMLKGFVSLGDL